MRDTRGKIVIRLALCAAMLLGMGAARAGAPAASRMTQRRINDIAAVLERGRRALLEEPHLRQPGETLPNYLNRIAGPLPHETPATYRTRVEGYLKALERVSEETAPARQMPALHSADAANQNLWRHAGRDLGYLPKRMTLTQAAWKLAQNRPDPAAVTALGAQLDQTLQLILDAYARLRDAQP